MTCAFSKSDDVKSIPATLNMTYLRPETDDKLRSVKLHPIYCGVI